MVKINKEYLRKESKNKVGVIPFKIELGKVHYRHIGYFDLRIIDTAMFLERYELKTSPCEILTPIDKVIAYLTDDDKNNKDAQTLRDIPTEFIDVSQAFSLGLALQNIFEIEAETSATGISEGEILEVIKYARENMRQDY